MILYGISVADPSKKNLEFDNKQSSDGYNIERKVAGFPLPAFTSEQTGFRKFPEDEMPSSTGIPTTDVSTIPVTQTENLAELDLWRQRRDDLWANVEQPRLEADKNLRDTSNNGGAWFDPKTVNPSPEFKETLRQTMRIIRDPASKIADPYNYAEQCNYVYTSLYGDGKRNYQSRYYTNNPYMDPVTGRVHLFDAPFTRRFA